MFKELKTKYQLRHVSAVSKGHLLIFIAIFAALGGYLLYTSLAAPNPNLPGDLNSDNNVNITDLSILLSSYGTTNSAADINSDGTVNVLDLSVLLSHYGQSVSGGQRYYVSASSGNDTNPGTATSPWQHLSKANSVVQPGDTVVLSGTFDQQSIAPAQSGSANSPITYTVASPGAATLDHSPNNDTGTIVALAGKNYITIDGINFDNSDDGNPSCPGSVSYWCTPLANHGIIASNDNHITIKNCNFHHVQVQFINSDDGLINNNTGDDFIASYNNPWPSGTPDKNHPTTAGDMIVIGDGSQRNTISNNVLHNAGHSDIEVGFGHLNELANDGNLITGNTLDNHWWKDLIAYGDGKGTSSPTVFEHNLVENANSVPAIYSTVSSYTFGLNQLAKSSSGMQFSGSNFIVRYNTFTNNVSSTGTLEFGSRWYNVSGTTYIPVSSDNNQIYGNTFYNNKGPGQIGFVDLWSAADKTAGRAQLTNTGNLVENNIFWGNSGSADSMFANASIYAPVVYHYCCEITGTNTPPPGWGGNTISHNIFDNTPYACITDVTKTVNARQLWSLTQCLTNAAPDILSVQIADPLFINGPSGDFRLSSGSPAINAGIPITGQAYNGAAPDLGAFEF